MKTCTHTSTKKMRTQARMRPFLRSKRRDSSCHTSFEKGKAQNNSGVRAEQLKICSKETKKRLKHLQRHCETTRFHTEQLVKDSYQITHKKSDRVDPGNYKPICWLPVCTNYLRRYCVHAPPPVCTKFNHQTKQISGRTTDAKITWRCTGSWGSAIVSGVYRCTSIRLISRRRSTVSSIRR